MSDRVAKFKKERDELNRHVLDRDNVSIKRFFNLDSAIYKDGALDKKTKELLGLVASVVLRCDDCIAYHLIRSADEGVSDEEMDEVMSIGLIAGGSITIPHIRRGYRFWQDLKE